MATAEELLSGRSASEDKTLIISNDLRTINIPSSVSCLGVEYDDDVLELNFRMPRYLGKTDLSRFAIRVNYMNVKGEKDAYTVKNAVVGSEYITFSWLVGPTATKYKGNTSFNVCLKTLTSDGYIDREFNTTIATLPVLEGLEADESIVAMYSDILEQWRRELFGIGDTEEATIRAASQEEQENIAQKGVEVLGTIPEDYTETYNLAHDSVRTRANAIICSAQGEIISVSDSSGDYLRGLRVLGKTTQVSTTGKNLLNIPDTINSIKGVSFIVNPDKSVSVSGTPTEICAASLYGTYGEPIAFPAGTYIISGGIDADRYLRVRIHSSDGTLISMKYADSGEKEFTISEGDLISVSMYFATLESVNGLTFYPMIRLATVEDDTYEPYSGGVASPCPEWPQELTNVGDNGSVTSWIHNNNLANLKDAVFKNCVLINKDTGSVRLNMNSGYYGEIYLYDLNEYMLNNQSKTYTFKVDASPSDCQLNVVIHGTRTADNRGTASYQESNSAAGALTTSITPIGFSEITAVVLRVGRKSAMYSDTSTIFSGISFSRNYNSEFESSAGLQTIKVTTTNGLPGVPVNQNGNYTDSNGQQWICDEINYENQKYIKRIADITLDGTQRYGINSYQLGSVGKYLFEYYPGDISQLQTDIPAMSDRLIWDKWGNFGPNENRAKLYATSGRLIIFLPDQTIQTVEAFETYLASNPIHLMYVLAIPIETPLTAEEIEAFKALHSNYPNTTVLNDAGAMMELKYNADTQIYLDRLPKATDEQVQTAVDDWLTAHFSSAEGVSF